jgi:hypothetical protein
MGLDMYLTAEKYISGYSDIDRRDRVVEAVGVHPPLRQDGESSATVTISVAYWRKANAIHEWFVREAQDGNDDCQKHFVSVQSLKELVATCEDLLAKRDPEEAADVLPTADGFFFGSTDYDDWYWDCLEETVTQLKPLVEWFDSDEGNVLVWDLYYQSSW